MCRLSSMSPHSFPHGQPGPRDRKKEGKKEKRSEESECSWVLSVKPSRRRMARRFTHTHESTSACALCSIQEVMPSSSLVCFLGEKGRPDALLCVCGWLGVQSVCFPCLFPFFFFFLLSGASHPMISASAILLLACSLRTLPLVLDEPRRVPVLHWEIHEKGPMCLLPPPGSTRTQLVVLTPSDLSVPPWPKGKEDRSRRSSGLQTVHPNAGAILVPPLRLPSIHPLQEGLTAMMAQASLQMSSGHPKRRVAATTRTTAAEQLMRLMAFTPLAFVV